MSQVITDAITKKAANSKLGKLSAISFRWAGIVLFATVWVSAMLFGLYILAFYAAPLYEGNLDRWNKILPGLYTRGSTTSIKISFLFA